MVTLTRWHDRALCAGMDYRVFFPVSGESRKTAQAKQVCAACPVSVQCLALAMDTGTLHGIFGGMTPMERRALRRETGQPVQRIVRDLRPHGSMAAVKRHERAGERLCLACLEVKSDSQRRRRLARTTGKTEREAVA
jgi:WhiB family redox-sensing transcriptional regulator